MVAWNLGLIVGQRLWQGLAGLVTIVFVAHFLSAEEQGWYYTFISVAAFYSVFEMGLSAVLVQTSAHLFVGLNWQVGGGVVGATSRLFGSFLFQAARAYLRIAGTFAIAVAVFGVGYFSVKAQTVNVSFSWLEPWLVLVMVTAANLVTLPFLAIVEGSGAVSEVYGLRLLQGIAGALMCWLVLAMGGTLWAAATLPGMGFAIASFWLWHRRPGTMSIVLRRPIAGDFDWHREIWPLQWRIGLNWTGVYLMSQLATPILFYFQDAVLAGQMGLSLTVAHMLGLLAQSPLVPCVMPLSRAVANRDWAGFDRIFRKGLLSLVTLFFLGTGVLGLALWLLSHTAYSQRVLPHGQFAGLLLFVFFYQMNAAFATQLRAFRREPLAWISVVGAAIIVIGSLVVGRQYASAGVIWVMVTVQVGLVFPLSFLIWKQSLVRWRSESTVRRPVSRADS